VSWAASARFQAWLGPMSCKTFNVYVSVNAVASRSTTIGPRFLGAFLHQHPGYQAAMVSRNDFRVSTRLLTAATPLQWELMRRIRTVIPT
jgi:hypothetical protein